jgi:hypothetical protein
MRLERPTRIHSEATVKVRGQLVGLERVPARDGA